jgi:hypothetical protein
MRLVCPNYFSDEVLALTKNMARNVSGAATRPLHRELAVEDFEEGGQFTAAFESTGYKIIDMDLDEWGAQQQAERCGMRFFELTRDAPGGSTDPDSFRRAVLEHYKHKQLEIYPICFTETQMGKFQIEHAQQQIGSPLRFSLRASLKRRYEAIAAVAEEKGEEKEEEWGHGEADEEEEEMASDGDVDDAVQEEEDLQSMGFNAAEEPQILRQPSRQRGHADPEEAPQRDEYFHQRMLQAAQNRGGAAASASRPQPEGYDAFRNFIG